MSSRKPGPNGIAYLLYKKCPKVLGWLHKMIRSAWRKLKISDQWMIAVGVCIPKEQNSTDINQFRPISLLKDEGKICFSVMAARLTKIPHRERVSGFVGPERRYPASSWLCRTCDDDLGCDPKSKNREKGS